MNKERDKYLTEQIGECWHNDYPECQNDSYTKCEKCGEYGPYNIKSFNNFSTWEGFGKLWTWAKEQDWFERFLDLNDVGSSTWSDNGDLLSSIQSEFIDPNQFANEVYEYLKENKDE